MPLKDKSQIWKNYFRLQIKLICILYNFLFIFGSFVELTEMNCLIFCFLINVWTKLYLKIFLIFYTIGSTGCFTVLLLCTIFFSRIKSFVMCNKKLYQTPPSFRHFFLGKIGHSYPLLKSATEISHHDQPPFHLLPSEIFRSVSHLVACQAVRMYIPIAKSHLYISPAHY
jgi:hypothetical protein